MKHRNLGKVLQVLWFDSNKREGDHSLLAPFDPYFEVNSVGFFIDENENWLWIAEDFNKAEQWFRNVLSIPKVNIIKKKFLR